MKNKLENDSKRVSIVLKIVLNYEINYNIMLVFLSLGYG
jgi:hypothetical protein